MTQKQSLKQDRMSDRIREILSELLLVEVTDPALQGVTVTSVSLDREMEYADVRVNALGDESREKEVMRGLERANGFLRREVGARIRIRRTPALRFHWDVALQHFEDIEAVFRRIGPIPPADPIADSVPGEQAITAQSDKDVDDDGNE